MTLGASPSTPIAAGAAWWEAWRCPTCGGVADGVGPGSVVCRRGHQHARPQPTPTVTVTASGEGEAAPAPAAAAGATSGPILNGQARQDGAASASSRRHGRSHVDQLLDAALTEAELWHDPRREAYATVSVGEHCETWPLRSRAFREWLRARLWVAHEVAPSGEAVETALTTLEAIAAFERAQHEVFVRVAPDGADSIWIDLADAAWRAIHVTPAGWRIVDTPPVRFRRSSSTRPLPLPERGGTLDALRELLNIRSEAAWTLLKAWLRMALNPWGPYPVLALHGEQGAGKSTAARMLRALVDPAQPDLRAEPRELRDLMIAARGAWLLAFDNLSHVPNWLSDGLCRLATGGGFATRALYTDVEEAIFEARRPVLATGITEYFVHGDLLDRAVQVTLEPIPERDRQPEAALWHTFEAARPRLFGALLDDLAAGLRERERVRVQLKALPRMADFALWAVAVEQGRGEMPQFLSAYVQARSEADEQAVEASPIGPALLSLLAKSPTWSGTAAQLLAALEVHQGERRPRTWPATPRGLASELRRLAPALRRQAITVAYERIGHGRVRTIRISRSDEVGAQSSASSASSATPGDQAVLRTVADDPSPGADGCLVRSSAPSSDQRSWGMAIADDADGADDCAPNVSDAPPPPAMPPAVVSPSESPPARREVLEL